MIIAANKALITINGGGYDKNHSAIGAAVAAAIELSETVRLDKITAVNTASETKVAIGAKASKTPNAVATPFPPWNLRNTG